MPLPINNEQNTACLAIIMQFGPWLNNQICILLLLCLLSRFTVTNIILNSIIGLDKKISIYIILYWIKISKIHPHRDQKVLYEFCYLDPFALWTFCLK